MQIVWNELVKRIIFLIFSDKNVNRFIQRPISLAATEGILVADEKRLEQSGVFYNTSSSVELSWESVSFIE